MKSKTSDSLLNEGLPVKMVREKVQRKWLFLHEKTVGSTLLLFSKVFFSLDKYQLKIWIENSVFAIRHTGYRKTFTEVILPSDQTKPFAHSWSFNFHTSYKNGMIGHGGRGAVKMIKNNLL